MCDLIPELLLCERLFSVANLVIFSEFSPLATFFLKKKKKQLATNLATFFWRYRRLMTTF